MMHQSDDDTGWARRDELPGWYGSLTVLALIVTGGMRACFRAGLTVRLSLMHGCGQRPATGLIDVSTVPGRRGRGEPELRVGGCYEPGDVSEAARDEIPERRSPDKGPSAPDTR